MPQSFSITDIGLRREMNQDYIFASDLPLGNLSCLYLVADGMGGHRAGDYASKYTVETVVDHVAGTEGEDPEELLGEAYRIANTQIRLKAARHREFYGMGTTLVSCTICGDMLLVANVGDSRVYLAHGDMIQQITDDHTYVNDLVKMGAISKEEAHMHARKNVITRAIGANANNEPDCFSVPVEKGNRILLCSDGLYDEVDDDTILAVLNRYDDMKVCAEDLVYMANENGGNDNISVICIDLED